MLWQMERDGKAVVLGCAIHAEGSLSNLHSQQLVNELGF